MDRNRTEGYREQLEQLIQLGQKIRLDLIIKSAQAREKNLPEKHEKLIEEVDGLFADRYQEWYSESLSVIDQILPKRREDFIARYKTSRKRANLTLRNYTIEDWLEGTVPVGRTNEFRDATRKKLGIQIDILKSARRRLSSVLCELKEMAQAELFDNELKAAEELLDNGFARAAGAIGGVVLEEHLEEVCSSYDIPIEKKNPSINDLLKSLREEEIIGKARWRKIQFLADVRNKCVHKDEEDPKEDEVKEMLSGVDKTIKKVH